MLEASAQLSVRLVEITPQDRDCLCALMQLYAYDFSEFLDLDVASDGSFPVPSIDPYFTDFRRHGFLLHSQDRLVGFALVSEGSRLTSDEQVHDMAEFFVMRRYRKRGVGRGAASLLFDRFQGRWEVRQRVGNHAATRFWRRTIGDYTGGHFEELSLDDERWRGQVQCFDTSMHRAR